MGYQDATGSGTGVERGSYHTGPKAENSMSDVQTALNRTFANIQEKVAQPMLSNQDVTSASDVVSALNSTFQNISKMLAQQAQASYKNPEPQYYVYQNTGVTYDEMKSLLNGLAHDLGTPDQYLSSAMDLAQYNTEQSQAMAREQMAYQTAANAKAMAFNSAEAEKTRQWISGMSNTAHQREVNDLVKAGLNPILSANQGASTGTAANAMGAAGSGAKGTVDTQAVEVLMNAYKTARELELQEKSLSLQEKMNILNNETNRYMADKSAAASIYNAGLSSSANRYASELAAAANRYASDLNYQTYSEGLHNNLGQLINYVDNKIEDLIGKKPSDAIASMIESYGSGRVNDSYKYSSDKLGRYEK